MTSKAEGKGMDEARKQNEDEKHFSDIATAKFKVSQGKVKVLLNRTCLLFENGLHVNRLLFSI